ncbi:MAG: tetratricopeptide repeat protein, partial [Candidatus Scalindua sp.]
MSKLTNLLIPLVLISTGVISCANYSFVKKKDITNQQFVNTTNQNGNERLGLPQPEKENMTSQAVPANIPTIEKPSSMTNTKNKQPDNKAIDKEHVDNLPGVEQGQIKLNQVGLAHLTLGIAYVERDLIDQAICEFQSAIEANPHHLESYVRLGTTYGLKGMTNEALSEFKKAIDINLNEAVAKIVFSALPVTANQKVRTDVVMAHINLGNAYKEEGKLKRSQLEYEEALELKPEHPIASKSLSEIYYSVGTSYLENKEYDNAIDAFNTVLKLNPGFPQIKDALEKAHYNLGINYAENGKLNKAIIEFNKTMEINLHYAMLDKKSLNIISNDKKAVSGKQIHHDKNRPDENTNNSTNRDVKRESFHEEKEGALQDQTPHQIDVAGEMILAEKGNAKESEYDQNRIESQHPLLSRKDNKNKLAKSNKASFETKQLLHANDSRHEKVQLKTEISNENQGKKQIQEKIAQAKTVDTGETNVNDLDFVDRGRNASLQVRREEDFENSNTYNLDKEKEMSEENLAQFNQPDEDKIIAVQANSSGKKAVAKNRTNANYSVYTYNITRNYKSQIGVNDAIKKYEDATISNPYDNNAFLNLAHAYYCKAMYLDDAIARREDAPEGNQNFSVKRFYLND